ncbi:hypothetical protein AXF42_Ash013829 [Apostasia shenzhenica]|uniref:GIR1-like zinc ribbon domain-containing protein n=1 Tax=Apostasia shenzhenica TaxID=1088818 RepID=A0A2I0ARZ8_9ASPA|nr:hypothetical protein AXF42_Ash013829 [Apostasia shenzhenica]
MSRSSGKTPKPELRLNLTRGGPSRIVAGGDQAQSPKRSSTSSSSPSSCVSSENDQKAAQNSPEAKSMVLAGCPRCLIYVMLSDEDPKCPRCKSTVLLDFHHGNSSGKGC